MSVLSLSVVIYLSSVGNCRSRRGGSSEPNIIENVLEERADLLEEIDKQLEKCCVIPVLFGFLFSCRYSCICGDAIFCKSSKADGENRHSKNETENQCSKLLECFIHTIPPNLKFIHIHYNHIIPSSQ